MKRILLAGVLFTLLTTNILASTLSISTSTSIPQSQVVTQTAPSTIPEQSLPSDDKLSDLTKDDSKKPYYAFDYTQYGVETPNYDQEKIFNKVESKLVNLLEGGISTVGYFALLGGLISFTLIIAGAVSKNGKLVTAGIIGFGIELMIYASMKNYPGLFEAFSNYFWS